MTSWTDMTNLPPLMKPVDHSQPHNDSRKICDTSNFERFHRFARKQFVQYKLLLGQSLLE